MAAGADDCLFCKIGRGEIPAKKVHEDAEIFAFEDIHPRAPLHVLVCPREHVASLAEAEDRQAAVLGRLMLAAARIARQRGLDSFRTVVNAGPGAGQTVFHLHVHVLGGRPMDWPPG
jgi:histidine triad (HIT) family protein